MTRRALILAAFVLAGAAPAGGVSASAPPTPPDAPNPSDASVAASDQTLKALDDVLAWFADPTTIDSSRFTDAFLQQVPVEQLEQAFVSIGTGTWEAVAIDSTTTPGGLVARIEGPGPPLTVQLVVDEDGKIDGLLFQPAELVDPPTDLAGLVERLQSTAPVAGFLRADITADSACASVAELRPDELLPIGSVFKLYVLGAVAGMIESGDVTWDQPIEIRDELDSLPSDETQDEAAGSTLSVQELAQRMIEISDNTATDHLIDLVGRDRVEQALATLGHHDPDATLPMVTTRELFVIKTDPDLLARYEAADVDQRRTILADEVATAPLPGVEDFPTAPAAVTTVEWFASPMDVCRALVALDDMAARPGLEPIHTVLSANPGVPPEPGTFTRVLYKGGSEPGVLFVAWLGTRADGTRIVVTGGVADPEAEVDPQAVALMALGLTLGS